MKNYLILFLLFFLILSSSKSFAEEKWEFFDYDEYCLIQSMPIKTEIPEGKTRGDFGLIVYRMHKSLDMVVQITPGFKYKSIDSIEVKIDNEVYDFYTDIDVAWSKDDKKTIYAMKKGLELKTLGISSKGTKVIDVYTLKGFTSALNKLSSDC